MIARKKWINTLSVYICFKHIIAKNKFLSNIVGAQQDS